MSLRQALRSRFRGEKSEVNSEGQSSNAQGSLESHTVQGQQQLQAFIPHTLPIQSPDHAISPSSPASTYSFISPNDEEMFLSVDDISHCLDEVDAHSERDAGEMDNMVYELQLAHYHEQLMTVCFENQQLAQELKHLKELLQCDNLAKQLEKEKEKNKVLTSKLLEKESSSQSPSPRLKRFVRKDKKVPERSRSADVNEQCSAGGSDDEWYDASKDVTEHEVEVHGTKDMMSRCWSRIVERGKDKWLELRDDFTEPFDEDNKKEDLEGDPLAIRKLKANIIRFSNATKPMSESIDGLVALLRWESPGTTLMAFSVYMYTAYHRWFLQLALFLGIFRLFVTYLKHRGWNVSLNYLRCPEPEEQDRDLGMSDRVAFILQVARKVQNNAGKIADTFEKLKNLVIWENHDVTGHMFCVLCVAFVASCVLPTSDLFSLAGLYIGVKLFIIDYIFYRFPRIKLKYDTVDKLWRLLPTDAQLSRQASSRSAVEKNMLSISSANTHQSNVTAAASTETSNFCELFHLPASETPTSAWHTGKRCILINRDKSIASFKYGKLYLTGSYLCFERFKTQNPKNLVIPLEQVTKIEKAKSHPWFPGGGMAIEVWTEPERVYVFGTILNRDEAYESILEVGRKCGFRWAIESSADGNNKVSSP